MSLVIAGGGLAAARVAQSYREAGGDGPVTILAGESHLPYHRPPLTKRLLRGEAEPPDTLVATEDDWRELEVEVRAGAAAASLDLDRRELALADGGRLDFERLVVATGATPRRLPVPGADLAGVHLLRTLDDSLAIRARAGEAERAVVVGTGFIGMEAAASLRTLGLHVTLVDVATAPFAALGSTEFSSFLADRYRDEGVEFLLGGGVAGFEGSDSLEAVVTSADARIDAELAVVGIGVVPGTAWLEGTALEVDDGIVVDERYESSVANVFAAGDVARVRGRRRIEHWSNADRTGRRLGQLLAGADPGPEQVPSFFTELFGGVYKLFGHPEHAERTELDGSFEDGAATVGYFAGDRLVAALVAGRGDEEEHALLERIGQDSTRTGEPDGHDSPTRPSERGGARRR